MTWCRRCNGMAIAPRLIGGYKVCPRCKGSGHQFRPSLLDRIFGGGVR